MKIDDRKCLVSVILSTYNGNELWLRKAIDSVYAQTYDKFEFIIINDNSTNNIEEVIKGYMKRYDNIIYIKNKQNLGLTKSLNVGIENSHGKYIARIDDDDCRITKDKLEKQVGFMEKNIEYGLCGAGKMVRMDEDDNILFVKHIRNISDEQIRNHLLQENQFMHSGVLIRKSALDKVGLYNPKFIIGQDYELWCRIGLEYKMRIIPDIAIIYRFHHNSISSTKKKSSITISSPAFWINKNNYPHFYRALILRFGAFILPKSFRVYVKKFFFPNLHMGSNNWECNKKNILVLNYEFPPIGGGAAPISYDICKGYVDKGFNVDVITMGFKNLPVYENKDGINIHRVKCVRLKKEICYPFEQLTYLISGYFKAKQLLKQTKYDICHCHFLVPTGILALILKKRFGIKYFVTAHGSDVPGYNPNRFKILHKFTPRLLKQIINNSEIVISPSKYLAELIRKNIKGFKKDIEVIPNGIDSNTYIPQKKEKIIVGTGRLWPVKGLHLLANAFSQIEDTQGFELHILGDGPLMAQLKEIQNKSKNEIILHGWVDNKSKEYLDTLGKSMIFCLPSISENSPISILEGMSSGCSILTTASTGCLEMSKGVGIYISPTVESIKKQLEYLIKNNNICKEYGEKARQKILTTYKKELIIGKYIEICNKYI